MPDFQCSTCGKGFSLAPAVLAKYPNWTPRYCRSCSPGSKATMNQSGSGGAGAPNRAKTRRSGRGKSGKGRSGTGEENLPVAVVLERYSEGPQDGVFTDGGCTPNPGRGGWGMVHVAAGEIVKQAHGHEPETTNNRMEMTAIIAAFEHLGAGEHGGEADDVTIYSDSMLCINTLNQWAAGWERNGWKKKSGPVKNLDLVQKAWALKQRQPKVKLEHISAHSGFRWNEYADSLATAWMRDEL